MKTDPPYSALKAKPLFYEAVSDAKRKPVIVIGDAQDTSLEALLVLKAMTNFDGDSSNRITFILAGQPELATTFKMEIFHRTAGIARAINSLCYQAIVNGAIERKQIIDRSSAPPTIRPVRATMAA